MTGLGHCLLYVSVLALIFSFHFMGVPSYPNTSSSLSNSTMGLESTISCSLCLDLHQIFLCSSQIQSSPSLIQTHIIWSTVSLWESAKNNYNIRLGLLFSFFLSFYFERKLVISLIEERVISVAIYTNAISFLIYVRKLFPLLMVKIYASSRNQKVFCPICPTSEHSVIYIVLYVHNDMQNMLRNDGKQ